MPTLGGPPFVYAAGTGSIFSSFVFGAISTSYSPSDSVEGIFCTIDVLANSWGKSSWSCEKVLVNLGTPSVTHTGFVTTSGGTVSPQYLQTYPTDIIQTFGKISLKHSDFPQIWNTSLTKNKIWVGFSLADPTPIFAQHHAAWMYSSGNNEDIQNDAYLG